MVYLISYLKGNATYQLEWIVPEKWSTTAIRRAFYERFSRAEIIAITPQPQSKCYFNSGLQGTAQTCCLLPNRDLRDTLPAGPSG